MMPSKLLRAAMPLRTFLTPLSLTRPSILQSATYISSRSNSTQPQQYTEGTDTRAPSRLRNYASNLRTGTVVSVGRMDRTVRVLHKNTTWDRKISKYYPQETNFLVSDPVNSLREGDVIEFSSGAPKSRHVHHVVERIITPFGENIADRPAVLTKKEREVEREKRWAEKYVRRESKRLGRQIDLVEELKKVGVEVEEGLSTAQLIHKIHATKQRIGHIKRTVQNRLRADRV